MFAIGYSLCTDYELGAVRLLAMPTHLLLDALFGFLMLALPWVLKFSQDSVVPMSVIGVLGLMLTITTKTTTHSSADPMA